MFKKIIKEIKKYDNIFLVRHIGADPDAICSQYSLRELIKDNFDNKNVYAIGSVSSKFRWLGRNDKITEEEVLEKAKDSLLIVLDTPDKKRIDCIDVDAFKSIIKIDHHPLVDDLGGIECIDDSAASATQVLLDFALSSKFNISKKAAELLFIGIVSDSNRFLFDYTSVKTLELVTNLIKKTNIDFTSLYENLYLRPMNEIRFQGYIYQNMIVTDNGLGYLKLDTEIFTKYGVDSSTAGNMINNLCFIDELMVWVICSYDAKNSINKVSIRSRGPIINEVAAKYNGGGHKYASGARLKTIEEVDSLIEDLDEACLKYEN